MAVAALRHPVRSDRAQAGDPVRIAFSAVFVIPYFWIIDGDRSPLTITLAVVACLGVGVCTAAEHASALSASARACGGPAPDRRMTGFGS
ncbi:hypothetical protein CFP66_35455 [Pseudonocardia sp. MH-G8]|nr:hypothetical protein CFP66_35455 [Pseudonocardia sp. MH-G8]